ncbi:MAG: hypothetical protein WCD80_02255, partial [Desulfobaccales bacterium]
REAIRLALEKENIESRPVWKPMHLQPVFTCKPAFPTSDKSGSHFGGAYRARVIGGHVAEDLFDRGLCLPSGTAMTKKDLDRVVQTVKLCTKLRGKAPRKGVKNQFD